MPSFFSISLLAGLVHTAASRHAHVHPHKAAHIHHHHARQAVEIAAADVPTVNTTKTVTLEIISDLEDIKKTSAELPDDLPEYIQAVDLRMASVESRLGALLASTTSIAALESELSTALSSTRETPTPFDRAGVEELSPSQLVLSQPAPSSPSDDQAGLLPMEAQQSSPTIALEVDALSVARRTSTHYATVTSYLPHADASMEATPSLEAPSETTEIEQRPTGLAVTVEGAGPTTFARVTSRRSS